MVGYLFGLAASVLWFGALGDRCGRKLPIVIGMTPRSRSPSCWVRMSDDVLFAARVAGGAAPAWFT
jgi:MFS family permease